MKNRLILGTALSLLSSQIYSDTTKNPEAEAIQKPHSNSEVFLSTPSHMFELQLGLVVLQPSGSNLHYAAQANPLPAPSPNWKIHDIDPDYHVGFDLGIRGISHCSNTNLTLNWERLHSSDSASKNVASTNMVGPFFEIGPDAALYTKTHGKVRFLFDEVNLSYGIYMNLGNRLMTNLFSGISYARIKQSIHSKYSNLDGTIVRTISTPSTFIGGGPELGLEFAYRIIAGFHFTGKARALLLVGRQKNHTTYKAFSPFLDPLGISPPNTQQTRVHNKTQVVPGFETGLGFSYDFTFKKHYMVKLEAGYQVHTYINAIQSTDMGSEVVTPPVIPDTVGVFARTFEQNLSNFSLQGPYFLLAIGF